MVKEGWLSPSGYYYECIREPKHMVISVHEYWANAYCEEKGVELPCGVYSCGDYLDRIGWIKCQDGLFLSHWNIVRDGMKARFVGFECTQAQYDKMFDFTIQEGFQRNYDIWEVKY